MPLFSVITVTYKNIDGLQQTEASITAQTCADYEWIVIDGQSGDGSAEFLENTKARWISEPDNGIYDAMNKGIDRATGDYLIFMNAGDQFTAPDTLDALAVFITQNQSPPPDLLYSDALEENPEAPHTPHFKPARHHNKWPFGMFTHHQAMVYRRKAIHEAQLRYDTSYAIAADYKFTIQCIQSFRIIQRVKGISLCVFETGGVSQKHVQRGRTEQFKIRAALHAVPVWKNILIYMIQMLVYKIRRFCPALYWAFKSRLRR